MSQRNLYPGINPHLNSYLQHKTGWKGFHSKHLADIGDYLEAHLPATYYIADEESLQTATYDTTTIRRAQTIPDITVFHEATVQDDTTPATSRQTSITPTLTLPVMAIEQIEENINSIVIYHVSDDTPVTRIELLSPANKPPGSHAALYQAKREQTLRAGLRLVEIDYLHQRAPIDARIPSYPARERNATPYAIIISDPRPTLHEGQMRVYGFGVLDALPTVAIPLADDDTIAVDFNALYQQTFNSRRLFYAVRTDYASLPVNFGAYHEDDQTRIRQHHAHIQPSD